MLKLCVLCVENVVDVARDVNSDEDDMVVVPVPVHLSLLIPLCYHRHYIVSVVVFSACCHFFYFVIHQRILKVRILGCKLCKVTC